MFSVVHVIVESSIRFNLAAQSDEWFERFPNFGWPEILGTIGVGLLFGGLFGLLGSKGAILRRESNPSLRKKLPLCLRLAYRPEFLKKDIDYQLSPRASERLAFTVMLMFVFVWELMILTSDGRVDWKILFQFVWILPHFIGFFFMLLSVEYWIENRWYPKNAQELPKNRT